MHLFEQVVQIAPALWGCSIWPISECLVVCHRNNANGWFSIALLSLCPVHHFPDISTNVVFNLTLADTAVKFTLLDTYFHVYAEFAISE